MERECKAVHMKEVLKEGQGFFVFCCWLSCPPEGTHGLAIEPVGVIIKIADVVADSGQSTPTPVYKHK